MPQKLAKRNTNATALMITATMSCGDVEVFTGGTGEGGGGDGEGTGILYRTEAIVATFILRISIAMVTFKFEGTSVVL